MHCSEYIAYAWLNGFDTKVTVNSVSVVFIDLRVRFDDTQMRNTS